MTAAPGSEGTLARLWRDALDRLERPPDSSLNLSDVGCFAGVLLSLAIGLSVSWQRWGNPLVDSGRELNVPLRLLQGQMLYSDISYIYGPFSPYLNAVLYRVFRPSLYVIWGHGIGATILILVFSYWIARQLMRRFPSTLACLAVTWVCALKSQGNYMMAYSEGGLDGCMFVLATVALLIVFLRRGRKRILLLAGTTAALAVLSKTELGGGAIAAGIAAAVLVGFPRARGILLDCVIFFAASIGLPVLVYSWFAAKVGWHSLIVENHLFFGDVPKQLLYFNGLRFGFDHPWHSLGLMAASLVRILAVGGALFAAAQLIAMFRSVKRADGQSLLISLATLLICTAIAIVSGLGLSDIGPFIPMPILLVLLACGGVAAFLRSVRAGDSDARVAAGIVILVSTCGLMSLARIVLRVSTGGALSSFLLPLSVVLFVYLWLELFPLLSTDERIRVYSRKLVAGVLVLAVIATATTLSLRYRRKFSYPIVSVRGTWYTTPDLGSAFSQAISFTKANSKPDDAIAIFPEGSALTFLSERRNPLRQEILTPGFLDEAGETQTIESLTESKAPLVFIANRLTAEFGENAFGKDYDRRLMRWIEENYSVCGVFGQDADPTLQVGAPRFFIRAYCHKSSSQP